MSSPRPGWSLPDAVLLAGQGYTLEDAATFLRQLEAVLDRLDDVIASGATAPGCECAPELPLIDTLRTEPSAAASSR